MKRIYSTLLIIFLLISCSKENSINETNQELEEPEKQIENQPPSNFNVELVNISHDSAIINWSESTDPDNDAVTYDVYLNQVLIIENISELTYQFIGLKELTNYSGKIVAKDTSNNHTEVTFSFGTEKYYLKYIKKYDYGQYDYGPNGYAHGNPYHMIKTSDSNYLILGKSSNNGNGYRLFALKINYDGDEIWRAYFNHISHTSATPKVIEHSNGFLINSNDTLINIDWEGNTVWSKNIQDIISNPIFISSVNLDNEGNFYLAGIRNSGFHQGNEGVLLKISSNGIPIWEKTLKISLYDAFKDVVINSQNEIYVLGTSETKGATWDDHVSGDSSLKEIDFLVVKMNNQGDIIWQNTFGDGRHDFPKQIIIKSNNNIVFAGFSWGAYDISEGRIFEIDADGTEIWNISNELSSTFSIAETLDGGFITTGHVDFGYYGALGIYKFTSNGIEEWNKKYQETFTYLYGRSILIENDGGYRVAGSLSKNYYYGEEKPELLIYKTDSEGNYK
ncbi:fibronectin type III domain-containing protein [Flavobacteriaceae bacterium GSB9]|nr:fibronectin type III domain-containing protein [Flavobacteriaceae bacterium GSB9]